MQTLPEKSTILSPNDPLTSARKLIELAYTWLYDGGLVPTIHHVGGDFLVWKGSHYERATDDAIKAAVWMFLERAKRKTEDKEGKPILVRFQPKTTSANDVFNALKAATHLGAVSPPAWLDGDGNKPPAREFIACSNGLLHVKTRELLPHTPSFLGVNALPFPYDPKAPKPSAWLEFLLSLWSDDAETIETLQEWFGYALTLDTLLQKILLLIGPRRSGKGTITRILTALLGADNCAGPTMNSLAGDFGLQPLIDKQLAVVPDARLGGRSDKQAAIAERLLAISGEDGISVDRKHREAWYGRLPVRFMLLTNEAPRINDASGALASRFLVLQCTQSFLGKEDHGLEARLLPELPGILLWALEGLARLTERGRFVQPASAAETIAQIEDLSSPASVFVHDMCELGADKQVERKALYSAWGDWCSENGLHSGSAPNFGRELVAAFPEIKRTAPRINGKPVNHYAGIGLGAGEPEFEPVPPDLLAAIVEARAKTRLIKEQRLNEQAYDFG